MNDQTIILFFLIIFSGVTLFLYLWKAKKEIEYKKDERWQMIQNKAIKVANYSNDILIVFIAIIFTVTLFFDMQVTFTLTRVLIFGTLFIGLRNVIELIALEYFDKRL